MSGKRPQAGRLLYNPDCDSGGWFGRALTDTWVTRDGIEVSLRRGGGVVVAYRNHAIADRDVLFRHAPQVEGPYTEPDTVSEHMPDPTMRRHGPASEARSLSAVETHTPIASGLKPASTSRVSSA